MAHTFISCVISMATRYDIRRKRTKAVPCQCPAVALESFLGDTYFGTTQVGDTAATSRDQMLRCQLADGTVVGANEGSAQTSDGPVNQDIRYVLLLYSLEQAQTARGLRGRDNQPIYAPGQQRYGLDRFQVGIFLETRHNHVI